MGLLRTSAPGSRAGRPAADHRGMQKCSQDQQKNRQQSPAGVVDHRTMSHGGSKSISLGAGCCAARHSFYRAPGHHLYSM